jgi:hypothetical protein
MNPQQTLTTLLRLATMLRLKVTCTIKNDAVRLQYCGGVLHGANDEPALVISNIDRYACFDGHYYASASEWNRVVQIVLLRHLPQGFLGACALNSTAERRWYDRGDLHRDYGPAVSSDLYWYKYHRGAQKASRENTYTGLDANCCQKTGDDRRSDANCCQQPDGDRRQELRKYCADAGCTGCAAITACAPITLAVDWEAGFVQAKVYQTCAGLVMLFPQDCTDTHRRYYRRPIDHFQYSTVGYTWSLPDVVQSASRPGRSVVMKSRRLE